MTATVYASSGSTVNMRSEASAKAKIIEQIPIRSTVDVISVGGEWTQIKHKDMTGYMMTKFLKFNEDDDMIVVSRAKLQQVYDLLGELLRG